MLFLEKYGLKFNPFSVDGSAENEKPELQEVLINYRDKVELIKEAVTTLNPPIIMLISHLGGGKTKLLRYMEKHFQKTLPNVFITCVSMPPVKELIDFPKLIFNILKEKTPETLKKALSMKIDELEERCSRMPRSEIELILNEIEAKIGPLEEEEKRGIFEVLSVDVLSFTDTLVDFIKEILSLIFNVDRCLLLIDNFENYVFSVKDNLHALMYLHRVLDELAKRLVEDKTGVIVLGISGSAFKDLRSTEEESHFMSRWEGTKAFQYLKGVMTQDQVKELVVKYCEVAKGRDVNETNNLSSDEIDRLVRERKVPFNEDAIRLIWALTRGFPRDIVKLCYQALEKAEETGREIVDAECVMETLYAKENIQDEALNNLKAYIQRVCGCRAENAEKFVGEVLKYYVIPVDVAANILGDKNLELGKKYVDMLMNGGLVGLVNGKICLAVNFIQGLYRPPYEIIKPPVPIPGLPSVEKVKEGFIEALSYMFKDLFPCATIDKGDGEPWAVLLLKDVNVDWKGLTYYFACEDEKEFSLHLIEAQRLMVEKECHFILGYGLMEEGKLTKLLDGREGVFKFFSSSVTVPLNKQFFYIPATLKDIDDLQVLVSVGDEKRKKLVESVGLKDKFTKLKESLNMTLPYLLEKIDEVMPVYLTKQVAKALIECLEKKQIPSQYKREVEDFLSRSGSSFQEFLEKPTKFEEKLILTLPYNWIDLETIAKKLYPNKTGFTRFQLDSIANYLTLLEERGYVDIKVEDKERLLYRASNLKKKVEQLNGEIDAVKVLAEKIQLTLPSLPKISFESKDAVSRKISEIQKVCETIRKNLSAKLHELTSLSNLVELAKLYEGLASIVEEAKLKELFGAEYKENSQNLKSQIERIEAFEKEIKNPKKSMVEIKDEFLSIIEESKVLTSKLERWMTLLRKLRK